MVKKYIFFTIVCFDFPFTNYLGENILKTSKMDTSLRKGGYGMSIDLLLHSLPIDQNMKERFAPDVAYAEKFLADRDIEVEESVAYMFYNHLFSFLDRISRNECSQTLEEEDVRDQLTDEACELARELAAPLFSKYGIAPNECEEVLLATYFVMFLSPKD